MGMDGREDRQKNRQENGRDAGKESRDRRRGGMRWLKRLFLAVATVCLCIAPGAIAGAEAPADAEEWCGHYYKVYKEEVSVTEAQARCEAMGGYLLTLNSVAERDFINALRDAQNVRSTSLWTGLIQTTNNTEFSWMNGEDFIDKMYLVNYTNSVDSYKELDDNNTIREHSANDGKSFPVYHSIGRYFLTDTYHSSRGENVPKVKHGYICEWGDPLDITQAQVTLSQTDYAYNEKARMPEVKVVYPSGSGENYTLEEGHDYDLIYTDNVQIGVATVTVKGRGRFTSSASYTYRINPPQVKNVKLAKDAVRHVDARWDAVQGATDYEIWCSADRNFPDGSFLFQAESGADPELLVLDAAMERNKTYYVKVRAIAQGKASGGGDLYGEWSSTASISSGSLLTPADFWGCGNDERVAFSYSDYRKFYGPIQALRLYNGYDKASPVCYGMAATGLAVLCYNTPGLDAFAGGSLNRVKDKGTEIPGLAGMTAGQLIRYGQVWQFMPQMEEEEELNRYDLDGLYRAVKSYMSGGAPVMVFLRGLGAGGGVIRHAVCAVGLGEDTAEEAEVILYDPNYPYPLFAADAVKLHLYRSGNVFTGYKVTGEDDRYENLTLADKEQWISYSTTAASEFAKAFKKDNWSWSYYKNCYLVVLRYVEKSAADSMAGSAFGGNAQRVSEPAAGEDADGSGDSSLYWVKTDGDFTLQDVPAGAEVTVCSAHRSASARLDAGGDFTFHVTDGEDCSVTAQPAGAGTFTVELSGAGQDGLALTTRTLAGSADAGQAVKVEEKDGAVQLSGATQAQMLWASGTLTEDGGLSGKQEKKVQVPSLEAGKTYQFSATKDGLAVKSSSKNDGVFDEDVQAGEGAAALKLGSVYTSGGLEYQVTELSGKKGKAAVTGAENRKAAEVTIPDTVQIEGVILTVDAVGDGAFKGMGKLKSATVGRNVTKVGKLAFSGDKKLAKIMFLGKKLKSVGAKAVKGIYKKAEIIVPTGKVKAYRKLLNKAAGFTAKMSVTDGKSRTWKVTFKNGKKTVKTQKVKDGGAAKAPKLTKKGYVLGWSASFKKVTKNLIVKAVWTRELPKKGESGVSGGLRYKVTKSAKKGGTVQVAGVQDKGLASYAVPATVKLGKTTFAVTGIAAGAFRGCGKAAGIRLPKGILTIGKKAFSGTRADLVVTVPKAEYGRLSKLLKGTGLGVKATIKKK